MRELVRGGFVEDAIGLDYSTRASIASPRG
jgi:hypothetical protein